MYAASFSWRQDEDKYMLKVEHCTKKVTKVGDDPDWLGQTVVYVAESSP